MTSLQYGEERKGFATHSWIPTGEMDMVYQSITLFHFRLENILGSQIFAFCFLKTGQLVLTSAYDLKECLKMLAGLL